MRTLSDTLARLAKIKNLQPGHAPSEHRLEDLAAFGSNPGALDAKLYIPGAHTERPALVVVLHGCTQTAAAYDVGSGWSQLADDYGFVVLFPQQRRENNANLCFNWFVPGDTRRDQGEVFSIRQMIDAVCARCDVDRQRIFVTGLSAGGAMSNALLACYPDVFAGGAIIAGLPHGTASTIPEAFDRMRGHATPQAADLQRIIKSSSNHSGPWPTISVWQGTQDNTVVPSNAAAIIDQWRGVHGAHPQPDETSVIDGHGRQVWKDASGNESLEIFTVKGMSHGTPLDLSSDYGASGPFMLDVGISSTLHIARWWGLAASFDKIPTARSAAEGNGERMHAANNKPQPDGIQKIIEDALRSAGLMQ